MLYKFLRWCPGALGLLLRQKLYPLYLKKCGHKVLFGRFVDLRNGKDAISIGAGAIINDFVSLNASSKDSSTSTLVIEDKVFLGTGTTIQVTNGSIKIGSGTNLGSECLVQSDRPVIVEKDVLVAAFCEIGKADQDDQQLVSDKEEQTIIKSGSWLGVRVKVNAGKKVGEGTIVGAHARVVSDLPGYVVAIGNPAKVLRKRE
ncbi:MAG: hypothetical protein KAR01_05660 [Desulfocapsa sp.]|nr:hypothetical protein [Desulfocapsa sp.]